MPSCFHESFLDSFIILFIDDILVYSKSEEKYKALCIVFGFLKGKQLYAKYSMCEF